MPMCTTYRGQHWCIGYTGCVDYVMCIGWRECAVCQTVRVVWPIRGGGGGLCVIRVVRGGE